MRLSFSRGVKSYCANHSRTIRDSCQVEITFLARAREYLLAAAEKKRNGPTPFDSTGCARVHRFSSTHSIPPPPYFSLSLSLYRYRVQIARSLCNLLVECLAIFLARAAFLLLVFALFWRERASVCALCVSFTLCGLCQSVSLFHPSKRAIAAGFLFLSRCFFDFVHYG